jgi:putative membrane protein
MGNYSWANWYTGWGWVLWFGFVFLMVSSVGNWGYTYRAHRKYDDKFSNRDPLSILNERYARGEVKHDEYLRIKTNILSAIEETSRKRA